MVRRSDHCLPSDSDKFTIKLHSLPSKFPSSALLRALPLSLSYSLASVLFLLCCFRAPFPRRRSFFSVDTWELLWRNRAILTGDNHNSLYTRTTLRVFFCPLRVVPPVFRPSRPSRRHFPSLFISFCFLFSLPRLFPSLLVAALLPRAPIVLSRRPRLFRNCFRPFLLLLRLQLAGGFRMPSVTARALPESLFLFFLRSYLSCSPHCLVQLSWHLFLNPLHLPPDFLLFFLLLPLSPSFAKWATKFMR